MEKCVCVYTTESFFYTAEMKYNIVNQLYFNILLNGYSIPSWLIFKNQHWNMHII